LLHLSASSAAGVIRTLGDRLHDLGYVKDGFVEATLKREASMPTGLRLSGDYNAAIPHVDIEYVVKPALALAALTKEVQFQNMGAPEEEVPVQLVIMMALDEPKSQVEMLRQVATVLQSPDLVDRLMSSQSVEEVLSIIRELEVRS
jgi:PTS system galactitol-specific IIA component